MQLVLMVDAYFTWWVKGVSYLCRLIGLLNMGYVDELMFGSEVLTGLPGIVRQWTAAYDAGQQIATAPAAAATPSNEQ